MRRLAALIGCSLATTSCAAGAQDHHKQMAEHIQQRLALQSLFAEELEELEARTGGTLGVVLLDQKGDRIMARAPGRQMAFCSAFKFQLAAAAYDAARSGGRGLDEPVRFDKAKLPGYSPVLEKDEDEIVTIREAIAASVTVSDNGAANILIAALGGPHEVTQHWRTMGDLDSRLDRYETLLNENSQYDARDTSTPQALANMVRWLALSDILTGEDRAELFQLGRDATTGLDRVRAGLPEDWPAGDKTGTCKPDGQPDQQINDIGWINPDGRFYSFAVMVQRPTASSAEVKAVMAEVGSLMARAIAER